MLKQTPLHATHRAAGARMVDFGGWDMPVNYGSQIDEHHAVRRDAGMFDVSHMRAVDLEGGDPNMGARDFLRFALANNVDKLQEPGKALYSCLLAPDGGVLDDLIVYFLREDFFRLVVNAGTADGAEPEASGPDGSGDVFAEPSGDGEGLEADDPDAANETASSGSLTDISPEEVAEAAGAAILSVPCELDQEICESGADHPGGAETPASEAEGHQAVDGEAMPGFGKTLEEPLVTVEVGAAIDAQSSFSG